MQIMLHFDSEYGLLMINILAHFNSKLRLFMINIFIYPFYIVYFDKL